MKNQKVRSLTRAAALLALLIALQCVTKPLGQLVTGSCVNTVLALSALALPLPFSVLIAVLSPFLAFLLGVGPQLVPINAAICLGNSVYCVLLRVLFARKTPYCFRIIAALAASGAKFLTLYLLIVQLLCSILPLKEKQLATFGTMFSYPQLLTALIGSAVALTVWKLAGKAVLKNS